MIVIMIVIMIVKVDNDVKQLSLSYNICLRVCMVGDNYVTNLNPLHYLYLLLYLLYLYIYFIFSSLL